MANLLLQSVGGTGFAESFQRALDSVPLWDTGVYGWTLDNQGEYVLRVVKLPPVLSDFLALRAKGLEEQARLQGHAVQISPEAILQGLVCRYAEEAGLREPLRPAPEPQAPTPETPERVAWNPLPVTSILEPRRSSGIPASTDAEEEPLDPEA